MPMFRKKPVVIEARQFTGEFDSDLIVSWLGLPETAFVRLDGLAKLCIPTLEGHLNASAGDWIVKGTQGEHWPVRADIFAATYEPADKLGDVGG